jgi:hypothetical protein
MAYFNGGDPEGAKNLRDMMGPHAVDQQIRQAVSMCWLLLPDGKKSIEAVEAEIRRLVDRALKDLKEDATRFHIPREPPTA